MGTFIRGQTIKNIFVLDEGDSITPGLKKLAKDNDIMDLNSRIIMNKLSCFHVYSTTIVDGGLTG